MNLTNKFFKELKKKLQSNEPCLVVVSGNRREGRIFLSSEFKKIFEEIKKRQYPYGNSESKR